MFNQINENEILYQLVQAQDCHDQSDILEVGLAAHDIRDIRQNIR